MLRAEAARQIAARRHVRNSLNGQAQCGLIEIDKDAEVAVVPTGIFVQAWVYVSGESIAKELGQENAA